MDYNTDDILKAVTKLEEKLTDPVAFQETLSNVFKDCKTVGNWSEVNSTVVSIPYDSCIFRDITVENFSLYIKHYENYFNRQIIS